MRLCGWMMTLKVAYRFLILAVRPIPWVVVRLMKKIRRNSYIAYGVVQVIHCILRIRAVHEMKCFQIREISVSQLIENL